MTIAGSDSSGGAGIQADLKVIALLGGYGTSVITALTAQNTLEIQGVFPIPVSFIRKQLQSVLSDISVDAVKTGMLVQAEIISLVAQTVKKFKVNKLVLDPVMVSESGCPLLEQAAVRTLKDELLPIAGLITPNLSEASVLTGIPVRTLTTMKKAARVLKEKVGGNVLIKGGHLSGAAVDLFYDGQSFKEFSSPRIQSKNTHGTGCTFSAALATFWGQGFPLIEAIEKAKDVITKAIAGAEPLGHGRGPTDPYAWFRNDLERLPVLHSLERAFRQLKEANIGPLIPEIQSNLGYALPLAGSIDEVAAFPGGIVRLEETIAHLAPPDFGASHPMARIILTAMSRFPTCRSAMDLRFSKNFLKGAAKAGFSIEGFDRKQEPFGISEKERLSLSGNGKKVLGKKTSGPDIVFDRGATRREPLVQVLGRSPEEVVQKIIKMKEVMF
ncbi:MAG: bifunctional hydroxymethylpyrimidine kinase/phosphomethylpyrimidine kinase [Desulfobacca sp.]|nr:bifunctional hydroxymethylpyrimidine kinase/phosphomethylpyrimidine kinase [Desulfobacca sp.]